ncbi:TPA: YbaB/EbfC family nucleoid-associated protein, partial [Candidatus Bipolaricaulota bacterium]|nr:YbaB/EbfC family nucleoid-associated protein [Candidatus Bipolaricaulota bacterium]
MRGLGDLKGLMQQAQRLQAEIAKRQQELAEARVEASAGGGMVLAVV